MAGLFGGLMGGFGDMAGGLFDMINSDHVRERADQQARDYEHDVEKQKRRESTLDYEPTYVGDMIGPYQRSSSPVARAYLESMLTGQNPQANSNPWSDPLAVKKNQKSFEGTYGAYDDLVARGARERKATPWKTTRPDPIDQSANSVGTEGELDPTMKRYYGMR